MPEVVRLRSHLANLRYRLNTCGVIALKPLFKSTTKVALDALDSREKASGAPGSVPSYLQERPSSRFLCGTSIGFFDESD